MSPLFKRLNLGAHAAVRVPNAPASFEAELVHLQAIQVYRMLAPKDRTTFAITFAITQAQRDAVSRKLLMRKRLAETTGAA